MLQLTPLTLTALIGFVVIWFVAEFLAAFGG